jgi:hypothetical protein
MNDRKIIDSFHEACDAFLGDLRTGDGFKEDAYSALCSSLRQLAELLKDRDSVPKSVANQFVDLLSGIEGCREIYKGALDEKIFQATDEIGDLARECCS